jgi:hypothetical protein
LNPGSWLLCESECGGERNGSLFTGASWAAGFQGPVEGFTGIAGPLDGFFAEGEAAVHGGSQVAPLGATLVLGPPGPKANTFP